MDSTSATFPENENRKRKSHTKSRKGCGNCKLRRVKCDEARPQCQKCINYGVSCNYDSTDAEELQLPGEGAFVFTSKPHSTGPGNGPEPPPKDSMSPEMKVDRVEGMLGAALDLHDTDEKYYVTKEDVQLLRIFESRTVWTIGTAQSVGTYRVQIINMAYTSSYLTHIVLTIALMHNRYTTCPNPWSTEPGSKESFHWLQGTAIFNKLLSGSLKEEDRDPLWGTAALLGAITLGSIEATTPEEAWPLKPPSETDLDWLRMSDGKKEVWRLVDPLRETSVWKDVMNYETQKDPEPYGHAVPELDMLYPFLTKIYDFDPMSPTGENKDDPYHTAASILVRLLELDCNHSNIMYFLSFLGHMDMRFRNLLHRKDPKALLLLAWWYGKMCQYNVWWQTRRMVLEGQAICMYLERNCGDQEDVVRLLDYPKMMTGLVGR